MFIHFHVISLWHLPNLIDKISMSENYNEVFLFLPFFRARDSHGAFLGHRVNCCGVFKFGVIGAEVYNENTRLQRVHLGLEYSSVLSISWFRVDGMFSVSFKWPPLKTRCSYLRMILN